ncbi:MAG: O-antigen ligase family protein [Patescibacteria group bacterium]
MDYFKISKFFLYLVPFAVVVVSVSTLFPFIVGKYAFFRTTIGLALIFYLLGLLLQDKSSVVSRQSSVVFKRPLVIAVSLFVFIFVLAGFFGVDPAFSFWSNFERGEGSLQIICLYVFFLLSVLLFEKKDWRIMFWVSIIAAGLMIFYGVGAGLKYLDAETAVRNIGGVSQEVLTGEGGFLYQTFKSFIGPDFRESGFRFAGSIGNPAYVATYLVFILFYVFYLLVDCIKEEKKKLAIILGSLAVVFAIFFFLAATRGAFVGLIAAILTALAYLGFSLKRFRKFALIIGFLVILFVGSVILLRDSRFIQNIPGSRIFDISFKAENFQNRTVIWKIAVDGFKERPILGWGAENFSYTFDEYYNPKHYSVKEGFGAWYDRAHNIFLDYLTQAGILGLLSFIGIWAVFYWRSLKLLVSNNEKNQLSGRSLLIQRALIFAVPTAYLIQGLVLFDILPTYINLFLFLAFANYKFKTQNSKF